MLRDSKGKNNNSKSDYRGNLGKGAIALAILAGVMGFSNPPREDYLHYASDKLSTRIKDSNCQESKIPEFMKDLSGSIVGGCQFLVTTPGKAIIKAFVDNSTKRQNLVIFSLYTTELSGRKYQTIGAFGNFLTFSSEKKGKS